jgi:NADPH:quinone reductase-like Zn-dependent oxidoreductase
MKAFILAGDGIENIQLKEVPMPEIQENEVLVKSKGISANPVDIASIKTPNVRKAMFGAQAGEDLIPGWDMAGEVVKVGASVSAFKVGDRVFGCIRFPGQGRTYAEYIAAPADQIAIIPTNTTFVEAAAASLAAITAYEALVIKGKLTKGQKVLIHASAGGVGHFAVQIAKASGAYVIGTASTANVDFVKSIGADEVIDYKKQKFEDVVKDANLVLDSIGGLNLMRSLDTLRNGGTVVSLNARFEGELADNAKKKNITGIRESISSSGMLTQEIARLLASGKLKAHLWQTYTFEDLPKALADMSKIAYGKLAVSVG